jgi:hypothetical protein
MPVRRAMHAECHYAHFYIIFLMTFSKFLSPSSRAGLFHSITEKSSPIKENRKIPDRKPRPKPVRPTTVARKANLRSTASIKLDRPFSNETLEYITNKFDRSVNMKDDPDPVEVLGNNGQIERNMEAQTEALKGHFLSCMGSLVESSSQFGQVLSIIRCK